MKDRIDSMAAKAAEQPLWVWPVGTLIFFWFIGVCGAGNGWPGGAQ